GLLFIASSLAPLIAIASYHRIVERGSDSESFERFLSAMMGAALLPLIIGFAIDLYVVPLKVLGQRSALIFSPIGGGFAVTMLYGIQLVQRFRRAHQVLQKRRISEAMNLNQTELKDRIDHVLTEARLVLPGAQALLGFQLLIFLTEAFDKLPQPLKLIHL